MGRRQALRCTARRSTDGEPCQAYAVVGATVCASHGGRAPQVAAAARRRVEVQRAERAMVALGLPRDVDPPQALLEEVHRTAGHVAWLAGIVAQLDRDALVRGITRTVQLPDGTRRVEAEAAVNTWVQLYQRERDLLRRVCATAIRAGAAEWQVRVAAEQAQVMIGVVLDAFDEVGLPVELQWRLRKAIAANLRRHAAQVAE